ncbi:hypothetical protein Q0Z83_000870 [Actinoplanes sichuanensis]|uniref:Uncharacterized protein n=1 Tax=Actinoplanes sichuanensis TaxID=512349 RepID=A0ABW4A2H3_9ACTN|nr:hypothetical protein [Actinoplanes sichuanensis]BEL01896.1 hypothetical protein Q0Z83_000870 [Actinoplanes sichuanensis]
MPLDDAIRKAAAAAAGDAEKQRTKAVFQANRLPQDVASITALLREAVQGFEHAGVKPTHVLRRHGQLREGLGYQGPLQKLWFKIDPPVARFEKIMHGWDVDRYFLASDGTLYSFYGESRYRVPSPLPPPG